MTKRSITRQVTLEIQTSSQMTDEEISKAITEGLEDTFPKVNVLMIRRPAQNPGEYGLRDAVVDSWVLSDGTKVSK